MNARMQRVCAWGGVGMIIIMLVGLLIPGFIPLPSPSMTTQAVADMYSQHTNSIRFGMVLVAFGAALLAPFVAEITVLMKRIEGRDTPLAYVQLSMGTLLVIEFIIPVFMCLGATFRPDRSPEITQALNDLCWLMFVGVVSTAVVQCIAIAIAVLSDRQAEPLFPRWVGYFNIWAAVLFVPGGVDVFFKSGPLAWTGLFTFWIPLAVFGAWFAVMTWAMVSAINRQEREAADLAPVTPSGEDLDTRRQVELLAAEVTALRAELTQSRAG